MRKPVIALIAVVVLAAGLSWIIMDRTRGDRNANVAGSAEPSQVSESAPAEDQGPSTPEPEREASGKGLVAIEQAAKADKYLFVFFFAQSDAATQEKQEAFNAAVEAVADKADSIAVDVTDPLERGIVNKFQVSRAPMPLVIVLAPNGAVTGGFAQEFSKEQLVDAFASPCMAQCLKALQERKLVLLCVQNTETKANDAAMRGVREFAADTRFSRATEIVMLDPAVEAEAKFLEKLSVDAKTYQATTLLLAPPGAVIAKMEGATDKEALVAALTSACGSGGCGSGGCGPR